MIYRQEYFRHNLTTLSDLKQSESFTHSRRLGYYSLEHMRTENIFLALTKIKKRFMHLHLMNLTYVTNFQHAGNNVFNECKKFILLNKKKKKIIFEI